MLRSSNVPVRPEIQNAVNGLLKENSNFDRTENRSAHREPLVRPVEIEIRDPAASIQAFSRNISVAGVGLITNEPIPEKATAVLKIEKFSGQMLTMLAECRWSKAYGENWYLSGWQFISLKR